MRLFRFSLMLTLFAIPNPAIAQHPQNRGAHTGGMAPHQGQMRSGPHSNMMNPSMHHEMMMQQWWQEQMMMSEMMSAPRARRHPSQPQTGMNQSRATNGGSHPVPSQQVGPSQRQPGAHQGQSGANQHPLGTTKSELGTNSRHTTAAQRQASPENGKASKKAAEDSKKTHREESRSVKKIHRQEANVAYNLPLAADQGIISLLKTSHTKLQGADHDYQGHRIRAMDHVVSALHHLGSSSAIAPNFMPGAGNLPQSQSDQILRDAAFQLRNIETMLAGRTNAAVHHSHARAAVAQAVRELHTALAIR